MVVKGQTLKLIGTIRKFSKNVVLWISPLSPKIESRKSRRVFSLGPNMCGPSSLTFFVEDAIEQNVVGKES